MKAALIILLMICLTHRSRGFYDQDLEAMKEERRERQRREWIKRGLMEEPSEEEMIKMESEKRKSNAEIKMLKAVHYDWKNVGKEKGLFEIKDEKDRKEKRVIGRSITLTATLTKDFIEKKKDKGKSSLTWDQMADKCDEWMYRINFVVKDVVCYPEESSGSFLIVVIKHWETEDVWKFLETQKDIEELTWDSKTVHPYLNDEL